MSKWLNDGEVLVGQGSGEAVPVSPRPRGLPAGSPRPGRGRGPLASPSARESVPASPQAETMGKARELFVLCDKEGKGFITKRDMQVSSWCGGITKFRLIAEFWTFHLLLVRGYNRSCRCPLNSWRRCLRVWTDRAMGSSLLLSSTQDLVSVGIWDIYSISHLWGKLLFIRKCLPSTLNQVVCASLCLWGAGELVGLDDTTELSQDEIEEDLDRVEWSQDAAAVRFVNILMELGADKLFKE